METCVFFVRIELYKCRIDAFLENNFSQTFLKGMGNIKKGYL